MLFRRRIKPHRFERIRLALMPRRSYARSAQYFLKRVLRINATPHAIALGVACGTFASFTPLLGFHIALAIGLAFVLSANVPAAVIGTAVGNPLTFPIMFGAAWKLGHAMTGNAAKAAADAPLHHVRHIPDFHDIAKLWEPVLKPMLIGSVPLGLVFGVVAYVLVRVLVAKFRDRRARRLAEKARKNAFARESAGIQRA